MKPTTESARIASHHLKHLMEYAAVRGMHRRQMLEVTPHSYEAICEETNTVTPAEFYSVLKVIDGVLNDELTGIRAGHFLTLKALGLVYQISLQTATFEEALFYLKNYLNATFPVVDVDTDITESDVSIYLTIRNHRHRLNRLILENMVTVIGREIKMMSRESITIHQFSPFYTPDYPASWSHGTLFGLRFKAAILRGALTDKSRLHLDILIPEYLKLTETLRADVSFTGRVKIAVLNLADPELPDLHAVAHSFNLTPRTLQRRLESEGNTFRGITDQLKQKISAMLLMHNRFSVSDISLVLGYSEPAAFIHSFKKWKGISPQRFRESTT